MPTVSSEEYHAFEERFEAAAAKYLTARGFKVISPFLPLDANGAPNLADLPDECAWVQFDLDAIDESVRSFRADEPSGLTRSDAAGFSGTVTVHHRVPMDDRLVPGGLVPVAYKRLCRQRGRIRSLFIDSQDPLGEYLPWDDVTLITLAPPDRRAEQDRLVNQASERFRITWLPREGIL